MAEIVFQTFSKLRNNEIDCNDDDDIRGLTWLSENHDDKDIRNQAIMTLIRCGRVGGKSNLLKKKTIKNKRKKSKKNQKRKKSKKNQKRKKSNKNKKKKSNKNK